jgi:hypothetical protein
MRLAGIRLGENMQNDQLIDYQLVVIKRLWLRDRDSNPDRLIQSQLSYHWTIPQRTTASIAQQPDSGKSRSLNPGAYPRPLAAILE